MSLFDADPKGVPVKKLTLFLIVATACLLAKPNPSPVPAKIQQQMKRAGSWKPGCPVPLRDLSYLRLAYLGFDGKRHTGELVVHKDIAAEVQQIFGALLRSGYPIYRMRLVSHYHASDFQSIEADNTSAFNCRPVTGGKKWSKHSYGRAIDINPIENPYISRSGHIAHPASLRYGLRGRMHRTRTPADKAIMLPSDPIVRIFKRHGWRWGGDWHTIKDYQHFDKPHTRRYTTPAATHPSSSHKISPPKLFGQLF